MQQFQIQFVKQMVNLRTYRITLIASAVVSISHLKMYIRFDIMCQTERECFLFHKDRR